MFPKEVCGLLCEMGTSMSLVFTLGVITPLGQTLKKKSTTQQGSSGPLSHVLGSPCPDLGAGQGAGPRGRPGLRVGGAGSDGDTSILEQYRPAPFSLPPSPRWSPWLVCAGVCECIDTHTDTRGCKFPEGRESLPILFTTASLFLLLKTFFSLKQH